MKQVVNPSPGAVKGSVGLMHLRMVEATMGPDSPWPTNSAELLGRKAPRRTVI